jgi:hypothetical protein
LSQSIIDEEEGSMKTSNQRERRERESKKDFFSAKFFFEVFQINSIDETIEDLLATTIDQ